MTQDSSLTGMNSRGVDSALIGWNSPEVTPQIALSRFLGTEPETPRNWTPALNLQIHIAATGRLVRSLGVTNATDPIRFVNAIAAAFGGKPGESGGWRGIVALSVDAARSSNPYRPTAIMRLQDADIAGRIPRDVQQDFEPLLRSIIAWNHAHHWFDRPSERSALDDILDHRVDDYLELILTTCGPVEGHAEIAAQALGSGS